MDITTLENLIDTNPEVRKLFILYLNIVDRHKKLMEMIFRYSSCIENASEYDLQRKNAHSILLKTLGCDNTDHSHPCFKCKATCFKMQLAVMVEDILGRKYEL